MALIIEVIMKKINMNLLNGIAGGKTITDAQFSKDETRFLARYEKLVKDVHKGILTLAQANARVENIDNKIIVLANEARPVEVNPLKFGLIT